MKSYNNNENNNSYFDNNSININDTYTKNYL